MTASCSCRSALIQRRQDEIFSIYLNQIYFRSGAWSVEEASQTYFNKSIQQLTLGESVFLAFVPKRPSR